MRLLPRWPVAESPADTRKWVALLASFGGTVVFTVGSGMLVWIIWKGQWSPAMEGKRLDLLGWALMLMLAGMLSGNWAFGFVLNRRSLKITKEGIEASGGDPDPSTIAAAPTAPPTQGE